MQRIRRFATGLVLLASSIAWAATGAGNSAGAQGDAFNSGCTCHNASPTSAVTVAMTGLPSEYETNTTYALTLTITGGPTVVPAVSQNQGGLAVKVSAGVLGAGTGTQLSGSDPLRLTHTAAGNNQRTWTFSWTAPATSVGNVTFTWFGNAVNGDTLAAGNVDQWNRGTATVPPKAAPPQNNTSPTPTDSPGADTSSLSVLLVGGVLVAVAVVARRRR